MNILTEQIIRTLYENALMEEKTARRIFADVNLRWDGEMLVMEGTYTSPQDMTFAVNACKRIPGMEGVSDQTVPPVRDFGKENQPVYWNRVQKAAADNRKFEVIPTRDRSKILIRRCSVLGATPIRRRMPR